MNKFSIYLILFALIHYGYSQDKWQRFNNYWYQGEAELTSYSLQQSRYGEIHDGHAVLVFVTEPFSSSKQVKMDFPERNEEDKVSVLKLNFTKKFLTGIYPYSMMMSSFVPVSYDKYPDAFKVTTTSQEWCGHTYVQLNLSDDEYDIKGFSYFESEGDWEEQIDNVWLEDEIWQRIRIEPRSLPLGSVQIVPGTMYTRLSHDEIRPLSAKTKLSKIPSGPLADNSYMSYQIQYNDRELNIYYTTNFPYQILGWEESYRGLTTSAKLNKSIKSPYWTQNGLADRKIRVELGLSPSQ